MLPKLCVAISRHGESIDVVPFEGERLKIGRLLSADVYLEDSAVARLHALIERTPGDLRVVDLGSPSGTKVAGVAVERHHPVGLNQPIEIGPFVLRIRPAPQPTYSYGAVEPVSVTSAPTPGDHVAEVITTFGDTVIDVRHIGRVHRRDRTGVLIGAGLLVSAVGFGSFAYEVAQPWDEHAARSTEAAERGAPRPVEPGHGWPMLSIALGLLGLVPLTAGAMRRRDPEPTAYTIGEAPDAVLSTPSEGLPNPGRHPLVEADERGVRVRLGTTMRLRTWRGGVPCEPDVDGTTATIPVGTQGVIAFGALSFHVRAVEPGQRVGRRRELDKPFWLYNAGTGALGLCFFVLTMLQAPDASSFGYDDDAPSPRFAGYFAQPDEPPPPEPGEAAEDGSIASNAPPGEMARGETGAMGSPTSKARNKRYAIKGPADATPTLSRDAFDGTHRAGILGVIAASDATFIASVDGSAFAIGNDDADLWGNLHGVEQGEAFGVAGLGLVGTGRHGGGRAEGVIGLGRVGLIGGLPGGGGGGGYGDCRNKAAGCGARLDGRRPRQPQVSIARSEGLKGMDEDVIRRVVRAHINEVRHCYNQGLVGDPNLSGRVPIQFTIATNGKVAAAVVASSTLPDRKVGTCIATAVRRWVFPTPPHGGSALVTYPFVLQPGG